MSAVDQTFKYFLEAFPEGNFKSIVNDDLDIKMFEDMYTTLKRKNLLDKLKGASRDELHELSNLFDQELTVRHSGSSFWYTMMEMKRIAENGWNAYVLLKLTYYNNNPSELSTKK
jgi:hypothetical protein